MNRIPDGLYKNILKYMPRPCVDIVIRHGDRILLLHRLLAPGKSKWSLPGGMIEKGETLEQAAIRKCREEVGLNIGELDLKFLGVFDYFTCQRHDIGITFIVDIDTEPDIILDSQHDSYLWAPMNDLPSELGINVMRIRGLLCTRRK